LDDLGHVDSVTAISGLVNPALLFFDRQLTTYDRSLIRTADIRYIVIDTRLAKGLPLYGTYIASGEPQSRLTLAELDKFDSIPGVRRVYDNGPISVYELGSLISGRPAIPTSLSNDDQVGTGLNWSVFVAAIIVAAVWLARLRRRRIRVDAHAVVCGTLMATTIALLGTFVVLVAHTDLVVSALTVLLMLLLLGLRPRHWRLGGRFITLTPRASPQTTSAETPDGVATDALGKGRLPRFQIAVGLFGLALFVLGALGATLTARKEWVPPPELSVIHGPRGQLVADAELGSAGSGPASLELRSGNRVIWSAALRKTTASQDVILPAGVLQVQANVILESGHKTLREIG
jgi:hypothetical protein